MCSDGRSEASPTSARSRSIRSSAAISRIRVLTGTSAISSRSSSSSTSRTFVAVSAACRLALSCGTTATSASSSSTSYSSGSAAPVMNPRGPGRGMPNCWFNLGSVRHLAVGAAVRARNVAVGRRRALVGNEPEAVRAAGALLAVEDEALLDRRPVDDERERARLPPAGRVVGDHLDVVLGKRLARGANLAQDVLGVLFLRVEGRQAPHLPVGVAR